MSISGVRSSRGDAYQVCVAMAWAIRMIKDAKIEWLEVDSTRLIAGKVSAPVDDVIIGWVGGKETCCQCKKNQTDFQVWEVDDLRDDLEKAADHLLLDPNATVNFYTRGDFGPMARLVERAAMFANQAAFANGMPQNLQPSLTKLEKVWANTLAKGSHTVHDLLTRISFRSTPAWDDYKEELKLDLGQIVTRADDAFNALWTTLDNLGARASSGSNLVDSHRITRVELLELLHDNGCAITPPRVQGEVEAKLAAMSQIGRTWRRKIGDQAIAREAAAELLAAARTNAKVLLTDGPGAGKTCVLLDLVEALEQEPNVSTLFLQAREFAEAQDPAGREAIGLDPDVPALVSAMSQWKRVVVVIDSLDVLSVNSETEGLTFFLGLIDRLMQIPDVCVIVACRSFDLQYNRKLASQNWDRRVEAGLLDWDTVVEPLLRGLGIDTANTDADTRALLGNPRNLALFTDVAAESPPQYVTSAQELTEMYLDVVVAGEPNLGNTAMIALEKMAGEMLSGRRHQLPRSRVAVDDTMLQRLFSASVLFQGARREVGFGHQTLLDALAVREAIREGLSFLEFIQSLRPVPFIRPAIRAYFAYLRLGNRKDFRSQVREVFDSDVAFHIKRLVAESYAVCEPEDDDWSLMRQLFQQHPAQFRSIYEAAQRVAWHGFWMRNLVPMLWAERNTPWLAIHFNRLRLWSNDDPDGVMAYWTSFATSPLARDVNLRGQATFVMRGFAHLAQVDAQPLLEAIVAAPFKGHDFLGNVLAKWANIDPRGDELIWRYVSADVPAVPTRERDIEETLYCDETCFQSDQDLVDRFIASDALLSLAVSALESWGRSVALGPSTKPGAVASGPNSTFLNETTYEVTHSIQHLRHTSNLARLVRAVENAILERAKANTGWWKDNARRICLNDCGGLRYVGILALTHFPEANADAAKAFFADEQILQATDRYELGNLIEATAPFIGNALALFEKHVFNRLHGFFATHQRYVEDERYGLLSKIPVHLWSQAVKDSIVRMGSELAPPAHQPDIHSMGGMISAPFTEAELTSLSDGELVRLLAYSQTLGRGPMAFRKLTGGAESVDRLLYSTATGEPQRFMKVLVARWHELPDTSKQAILGGAAHCLRFRFAQMPVDQMTPKMALEIKDLTELLLTELERHPSFWTGKREGATALRGCASLVRGIADGARVAFLASAHITTPDPHCGGPYDNDFVNTAINSSRGELAEGMVCLAEHLLLDGHALPDLLPPTLMRLARDCHPAVRAVIIDKLAFLQDKSELGWQLFDAAFNDADERVWAYAAETLRYADGKHDTRAIPYLNRMETSTVAGVRKAWGRLAALAVLRGQMTNDMLLEKLIVGASADAWDGAASVWVTNADNHEFAGECLASLQKAAAQPLAKQALLRHIGLLFKATQPIVRVPVELFRAIYPSDGSESAMVSNISPRLGEWLCVFVDMEPEEALEMAEIAAKIATARGVSPFYDSNHLGTLLTSLLREAEERERSDKGAMLARVVALQDIFLSMPTSDLTDWLHAAERPDA